MERKKIDLHVRGVIKIRGGILCNNSSNSVTDYIGYGAITTTSNGKRVYILDPGQYILQFKEKVPLDISFEHPIQINQEALWNTGASLIVNPEDFKGVLQVWYKLQIEIDSLIAQIVYFEKEEKNTTDIDDGK